jgi:hypothetical protein
MSEESRERHNDHPGYAEGWRDACDGEPLFPDASEPYAAGWRGWYAAKDALALMSSISL